MILVGKSSMPTQDVAMIVHDIILSLSAIVRVTYFWLHIAVVCVRFVLCPLRVSRSADITST